MIRTMIGWKIVKQNSYIVIRSGEHHKCCKLIFQSKFLQWPQMKTEKWLVMRYLLTTIWRLYFHPAKFDNFKDEKMSDYKTVSVAQSKNLLDWKPASLTNFELFLRAVSVFFGQKKILLKYFSVRTKKSHKMKLKKNMIKKNEF